MLGAFHELGTNRTLGFAVGPIPERDVTRYARDAGLDFWHSRLFAYLIRIVDNDYLDQIREKQRADEAGGTADSRIGAKSGRLGQ